MSPRTERSGNAKSANRCSATSVQADQLAQNIGARSILITFEHQADASLRNTLVINRDLGLIERVIQVGLPQVVLVDVIPGKPFERHIPTVWPEPEVIYPEY